MWCVVHVGEGREAGMEAFMRKLFTGMARTRCFHLVQHRVMRFHGTLWDVPRKYFPGYVFIETDDSREVEAILKKTGKKLPLGDGEHLFVLNREEEAFFKGISDEKGEIGLSVARVCLDAGSGRRKVEYLSGPLASLAHRVVSVDYHKRFAEIDMRFSGGTGALKLDFYYDGEEISRGMAGAQNRSGEPTGARKKNRDMVLR